jgi:hypothetical protein
MGPSVATVSMLGNCVSRMIHFGDQGFQKIHTGNMVSGLGLTIFAEKNYSEEVRNFRNGHLFRLNSGLP